MHMSRRFRNFLGDIAEAITGSIWKLLVGSDSKQAFPVPERMDFLELVWGQEDDCEAATDKLIPGLGSRAPACLENLGTVLSLLDRMALCWWACQGGDHLVEYQCGRVASNARAAIRMLRFGFYDEALMLCRSIGETSNLLNLFALDQNAFADWKSSSRRDRMNNFGPMRVRKRLENLSGPLINEERYRLLSERATHSNPHTRPQSHNVLQVPRAGASIQGEGLVLCLNELALSILPTVVFGTTLLSLEGDTRDQIFSAAESLAKSIGSITITQIDEYHNQILADPAAREHFGRVAAELRRMQSEIRRR